MAAQSWLAPANGYYKINIVWPWMGRTNVGELRWQFRDWEGAVIGACALKIQHVMDAFAIEAMRATKAPEFAKNLGLPKVILEGDALSIIKKLSAADPDFSPIGPIVDEAKAMMHQFHASVLVQILARQGLLPEFDQFWIEEFPESVSHYVQTDVNSF
ncbi:hypothetical protein REPUB_Repub16aG0067600 [Reevesia pubescens]